MAKPLDIFLVYQFLRRLATPFNQWDAYSLGVIDENGKVLKDRSSLSPEEKKAFGHFDVLVMNLKKLLGKVPGGKSKIASYAAALLLLKEQKVRRKELLENQTLLEREFNNELRLAREQGMPKGIRELIEEAPANAVGGGHIAGTDENPPVHMKKRKKKIISFMRRKGMCENSTPMKYQKAQKRGFVLTDKEVEEKEKLRKKIPKGPIGSERLPPVKEEINGAAVFEVDTGTFMKCRLSKRKHDRYEKYIGECEGGEDIRQYGLDNPGKPIMVRDKQTGAMIYLRYGGKYPSE